MTSHVARLYALALAVLVFFVSWAGFAAHPWATPAVDPRVAALTAREHRLARQSRSVQRIVAHRWAVYRVQLHRRRQELAAAPAPGVRVVDLPPLTITRTS